MPISPFLADIEALLKTGTATEHTYRPALKTLFESVLAGCTAVNEPKRAHYGAPDFVIQQGSTPLGHVEAKDIGVDLGAIITDSERDTPKTPNGTQLKRYRAALPNLLYTDGLEWHWFVDGTPRLDAPICLATWETGQKKFHRTTAAAPKLLHLLQQFAIHKAPMIGTPTDLARRLAHVARWLDEVITIILNDERTHGTLHQQLAAFRETLLPTITHEEFADMYAQTLVYGLFAARVTKSETSTFTRFDAAHAIPTTNPFLRKMFYYIAGPDLDERMVWLVDDCAHLLQQTDMSEVLRDFGKATKQEDPVVHFYETFLAAYDPKTREMRGVYYTPEPVVRYIVRSVDYLLQTRFKKPDGLADDETLILDPATGTATFLHAVVQHIFTTLQKIGMASTWNTYVPEKLLPRLFGFELLMAPYTIAHLKLSMLLQQLGYDFSSTERLGIYLTNALDELPAGQATLPFTSFIVDEGIQAREVKQTKPVMVVLGNPPYSVVSANKGIREDEIREHFYPNDAIREHNPKLLLDDYVKFIQFGQWRIERTGQGILAFITNHSYLDNPTFRTMRQALMSTFSTIYILNLHGNTKKKEVSPDGEKDENVFDIQQGVAIGIFIKEPATKVSEQRIFYADVWGRRMSRERQQGKYHWLASHDIQSTEWVTLTPQAPFYLFVPQNVALMPEYERGWKVSDSMPIYATGVKTHRDHFAVDFEQQALYQRIRDMRETHLDDHAFRTTYQLRDTRDWKLATARNKLRQNEQWEDDFKQCLYRPFDWRTCYFSDSVMDYPRRELVDNVAGKDNLCLLLIRQMQDTSPYTHFFASSVPAIDRSFACSRGAASFFPLYLYPNGHDHPALFEYENGRRPNLSDAFIRDVEHRLGLSFIPDGTGDMSTSIGPEDIFHYIYAVFHSLTYRARYAELLTIDFPRVPLTSDPVLFKTLTAYGAQLVDLHLLRLPDSGGVGGAGGAAILHTPSQHGVGQHNITHAPIERIIYNAQQQRVVIGTGMYVEGVEPETWAMQIGGYQPLLKWLKDRKGRTLSYDEARHYMRMVLALRETRRLMGEIDAAVPAWPLT